MPDEKRAALAVKKWVMYKVRQVLNGADFSTVTKQFVAGSLDDYMFSVDLKLNRALREQIENTTKQHPWDNEKVEEVSRAR